MPAVHVQELGLPGCGNQVIQLTGLLWPTRTAWTSAACTQKANVRSVHLLIEHQTLDEMACLYITYHHLMVGSIGDESTASPGQGSNAAVAASTNMLLSDLHRHQSFGLGIALTSDQQAGSTACSDIHACLHQNGF